MGASDTVDQRLASFLSVDDDAIAEQQLGDLLEQQTAPLVRRIVSRRLGSVPGDTEDVCAQVMLQLMVRLRRERADPGLVSIEAFSSYVATAAHHACDHYVRAKYPLRWRLRNRIRHVLEHDRRFAIWKAAEVWTCGLDGWRGRVSMHDLPSVAGLASVPADAISELLLRLFPDSGGPLELTVVVEAAAVAWGIPLFHRDEGTRLEAVADREPRVDHVLDQRARLGAVWTQLRDLPVRQRHAILLNLRDDAITLFLTSGVVTLRGMAELLELTVNEFAALWNDLPLSDNVIAARLGCTRQQVINLRMAGRKRLANRLSSQANIGGGRTL